MNIVNEFLRLKKWDSLYPVQREGLAKGVLNQDLNFVVIAPTGSGKTGIAEIAIIQELYNKCKVIYTVPSHALIADKLEDFQYLSDNFKVEEGKVRFNQWAKADLIITTFELLYRACLRSKGILDSFRLVIIDEFHLLYDKHRGYNLEKVLTILKQTMDRRNLRTICISATIENKDELSEWLEAKIIHIPREARPSSLNHSVIDLRRIPSYQMNTVLCENILKKKHEPYLIFCATKSLSKNRAIEMCNHLTKIRYDEEEIIDCVKKLISKEKLPELERILCSCLSKGVGFYHSDLRREIRGYIANLFKTRQLDYLFCTTGLAYGINFPAKAVIVTDLVLWDSDKKRFGPLPIHLYRQMAGRAGRPQYDKSGYSYVVVKKDDDLRKFREFIKSPLPRVTSQIIHDEYFKKAILELVYSERNTDEQIISFFDNSLFHFQAIKEKETLTAYSLLGLLQIRVKSLQTTGFIERLGIAYKLTDFGRVVLEYLFNGYSSPELSAFILLNRYLKKTGTLNADFDLIYYLSKTFTDCRISKQPRKKSDEVEHFLENIGIPEHAHPQYSAYVVWTKWMGNVDEAEIDNSCQVYSSNLPSKMREMYRLLNVSEKLAEAMNYEIPQNFQVVKERILYGVREEELPFVKIRRIGREIAKELHTFCNSIRTNLGYTGNMRAILKTLFDKEGEEKFLRILKENVNLVGEQRASKILTFIKESH